MRRSIGLWLRNNALALGALVVLSPAVVVGTGYLDWQEYRGTLPVVATISSQGSVEYAGARWELTSASRLHTLPHQGDNRPVPMPDGLDAIGVTVTVHGLPNAKFDPAKRSNCLFYLGDDGRRWAPAGAADLPGNVRWPRDSGTGRSCDEDGPVQSFFLVPAGARPTYVDVAVVDGARPTFARIRLTDL